MVEFLEQLHTIGDVGKAASLELLIQFSIRRDGNAKLIPLIKNPELLAMALNNRSKISSEPRTFFDTTYITDQIKDKEYPWIASSR